VLLQDIAGQPRALAVLERALGSGHVAHAYLFDGPPGVGKRQAALGLAMALDCEASPGRACGQCETCRRIAAGLHPDVLTITSDGAQIVMEQAQQIVALGQQRPHEARARVIILDDADRLNANASNCLLKTLEEPLRGTHIVLVTSAPEKLLPTIRSRTQRVRFDRIAEAALLQVAAARGADAASARVAAVMADGSMARFLTTVGTLADTAPAVERSGDETEEDAGKAAGSSREAGAAAGHDVTVEMARALRRAAAARGVAPILDTAADLGNKDAKEQLPVALALLARAYRDALVIAAGAPELAVLSGDAATDLAPPPGAGHGLSGLSRALAAIVEADTALAGNVNATMALERLLLGLRREERAAT
jgi:DNA polymerase-3 subunit delta'